MTSKRYLEVPYVCQVQNNIFYLSWYHRLTTYQWIATVNAVNISHHVSLETLWFGSYSGCKACLNRGLLTIDGELVDRLLQEDAPILSCAGGLMVEHPLVREHIDRIDGAEDSVMGLSKDLVERLLDELSIILTNAK